MCQPATLDTVWTFSLQKKLGRFPMRWDSFLVSCFAVLLPYTCCYVTLFVIELGRAYMISHTCKHASDQLSCFTGCLCIYMKYTFFVLAWKFLTIQNKNWQQPFFIGIMLFMRSVSCSMLYDFHFSCDCLIAHSQHRVFKNSPSTPAADLSLPLPMTWNAICKTHLNDDAYIAIVLQSTEPHLGFAIFANWILAALEYWRCWVYALLYRPCIPCRSLSSSVNLSCIAPSIGLH